MGLSQSKSRSTDNSDEATSHANKSVPAVSPDTPPTAPTSTKAPETFAEGNAPKGVQLFLSGRQNDQATPSTGVEEGEAVPSGEVKVGKG